MINSDNECTDKYRPLPLLWQKNSKKVAHHMEPSWGMKAFGQDAP